MEFTRFEIKAAKREESGKVAVYIKAYNEGEEHTASFCFEGAYELIENAAQAIANDIAWRWGGDELDNDEEPVHVNIQVPPGITGGRSN